jgi:hypothetical protein
MDASGEHSPEVPTVFRLRVDSDEPLAGAIALEGEAAESSFSGWIELMAAITGARKQRLEPEAGE